MFNRKSFLKNPNYCIPEKKDEPEIIDEIPTFDEMKIDELPIDETPIVKPKRKYVRKNTVSIK